MKHPTTTTIIRAINEFIQERKCCQGPTGALKFKKYSSGKDLHSLFAH